MRDAHRRITISKEKLPPEVPPGTSGGFYLNLSVSSEMNDIAQNHLVTFVSKLKGVQNLRFLFQFTENIRSNFQTAEENRVSESIAHLQQLLWDNQRCEHHTSIWPTTTLNPGQLLQGWRKSRSILSGNLSKQVRKHDSVHSVRDVNLFVKSDVINFVFFEYFVSVVAVQFSTWSLKVFKKLRFRDGLVWTEA